jgi:hypothetical protein
MLDKLARDRQVAVLDRIEQSGSALAVQAIDVVAPRDCMDKFRQAASHHCRMNCVQILAAHGLAPL